MPAGAEETLPHSKGSDSLTLGRRRPPPAAAQLGTRRPRAGEFSNTPTDQPFSFVLPVGACQQVFARRRQCPGSDLCSGSRAVLRSQPPLLAREGCSTANRNGNWNSGHRDARRSPGSYAFSACLDVSFAALQNGVSQEEKEPAREHSPLRR